VTTNHPNRGKASASSTPTPAKIREARMAAKLSQREAAALIHGTTRAWQSYETDEGSPEHRRMHPGLWELFELKVEESKKPYPNPGVPAQ
jgi:putative transcriptional regulator